MFGMTLIPLLLLLFKLSSKRLLSAAGQSHKLLCEQVRHKAQELDLLLPEGNEQPDSLCGLLWDSSRLVGGRVNNDGREEINNGDNACNYMSKASETGQMLIISSGEGSFRPSLEIDKRRYDIIGGVVQLSDEHFNFLSYRTFSVTKNEISFNDLDSVIQFTENCKFFWLLDGSLLTKRRNVFLTLGDESDESGGEIKVLYTYLMYRDNGPLKSPYDICHLRLIHDLVTKNDVERIFGLDVMEDTIRQGIALVRFIQLLNVLRPEHCFKSPELVKISAGLQALKDEDGEAVGEKLRGILIDAIKFIHQSADDEDDAEFPFLSILMDQEPTIDSIFYGLELPPNEKSDGAYLLGKLLIIAPPSYEKEYHQYKVRLRLADNHEKVDIFCLRAAITRQGTLTTIGIQKDQPNGEEVFRIAHYGVKPQVKIKNYLNRGPQHLPLFRAPGQLFIYQHTGIEDATIE